MAKKYELIIFDWDGTLMNSISEIVHCIQLSVSDLNAPAVTDDEVRNIIGLGLAEAVHALFPGKPATFKDEMAERYRFHYSQREEHPALFSGVREVLAELSSAGYLLAVATGKSRRGLDVVLEKTALQSIFHATRCADETVSKPDPEMVNQILAELAVSKDNALIVGDTEYDLCMGKNAGIHSIGVSYGVHDEARLFNCSPVAIIDQISALIAYV